MIVFLFFYFVCFFFFFNDTATTEIYTLSLHDALPINQSHPDLHRARHRLTILDAWFRSEEHTSELQSHLNLVCRLLLEKKKKSGEPQTRKTQAKEKSRKKQGEQHS